jgi:DNA-binding XRE family transcriptional regulator
MTIAADTDKAEDVKEYTVMISARWGIGTDSMTTRPARRNTVTVNGRRFVLVAEDELKRLERIAAQADTARAVPPPFPPADARGNRPAAEYIQVSIARSIHRQRTALGLSQQELARLAGVRQETISRLESGKHSPTVRTVERIERVLTKGGRKRRRR